MRYWLVISAVLLTVACSPSSVTETTFAGSWEIFNDVSELVERADIIVSGTMGKELFESQIVEEDGVVAKTDIFHSFAVERVFVGDSALTGTSIPVGYWATEVPTENITPYKEGERLLLVLARFSTPQGEGWVPVASDTGVFDYRDELSITSRGVVGPVAGIELQLSDLVELTSEAR